MKDKIVITLIYNEDKAEWGISVKTNTEIKREGFSNMIEALSTAKELSKKLNEYKNELKNQLELF